MNAAAAAAPPFTKQMFSNSRGGDESHSGYTAANEAATGAGAFKLKAAKEGEFWPYKTSNNWKDAGELGLHVNPSLKENQKTALEHRVAKEC